MPVFVSLTSLRDGPERVPVGSVTCYWGPQKVHCSVCDSSARNRSLFISELFFEGLDCYGGRGDLTGLSVTVLVFRNRSLCLMRNRMFISKHCISLLTWAYALFIIVSSFGITLWLSEPDEIMRYLKTPTYSHVRIYIFQCIWVIWGLIYSWDPIVTSRLLGFPRSCSVGSQTVKAFELLKS